MNTEKDKDVVGAGCIVLLGAYIIGLIVATLVNGYAFSVLWKWFMLPVFDLPALTIGQAIGVSFMISYITSERDKNNKDKSTYQIIVDLFESIAYSITFAVLALAFGYVIYVLI